MIELTPELIRKHRALVEAKVTVKGHTRRSKKGKAFNVKQYDRDYERNLNGVKSSTGRKVGLPDGGYEIQPFFKGGDRLLTIRKSNTSAFVKELKTNGIPYEQGSNKLENIDDIYVPKGAWDRAARIAAKFNRGS